jgi:hypothetical protein
MIGWIASPQNSVCYGTFSYAILVWGDGGRSLLFPEGMGYPIFRTIRYYKPAGRKRASLCAIGFLNQTKKIACSNYGRLIPGLIRLCTASGLGFWINGQPTPISSIDFVSRGSGGLSRNFFRNAPHLAWQGSSSR